MQSIHAQNSSQDSILKVPQSITFGINISPSSKLYGLSLRYMYIGFHISSDLKTETMPSYNNYQIPHNSYYLKSYYQGLFHGSVMGHYDFTNYFGLNAGFGFYNSSDSILAVSNSTGWYYAHGSSTRFKGFSFTTGIDLYPLKFIDIQLQYDTYKKLTIGLNYRVVK